MKAWGKGKRKARGKGKRKDMRNGIGRIEKKRVRGKTKEGYG